MTVVLDFNAARRAKIEREYDAHRLKVATDIYCVDPGDKTVTEAVRDILMREMPTLRRYREQLEALS